MALLGIIRYERCLAFLVSDLFSLVIDIALFVGTWRRENLSARLLQLLVACAQIVWHLVDIVSLSHVRYFIDKLVIRCLASLLVRSRVLLRFHTLSDFVSEFDRIITDAALGGALNNNPSSLTVLWNSSPLWVFVLTKFALHLVFLSNVTAGVPIFVTLWINSHGCIMLFIGANFPKLRFRGESRWAPRRLS